MYSLNFPDDPEQPREQLLDVAHSPEEQRLATGQETPTRALTQTRPEPTADTKFIRGREYFQES